MGVYHTIVCEECKVKYSVGKRPWMFIDKLKEAHEGHRLVSFSDVIVCKNEAKYENFEYKEACEFFNSYTKLTSQSYKNEINYICDGCTDRTHSYCF